MSNIQPYAGGSSMLPAGSSLTSPWSRPGRAVARIVEGAELAVVQTATQAQVEQSRIDAIDGVAARALHGVALVSALEQQLATSIPFASSRLQAIADSHALVMTGELMSFARRL